MQATTRRRRFRDADAPDAPAPRVRIPREAPATPKQLDFVRDLLGQVELTDEQQAKVDRQLAEGLTKKSASAWIDRLLELKRSQPPAWTRRDPGPAPEAGMYRLSDGTIVRVYLGQNSGNMLAKRLVDTGEPHPEDPEITLHEYSYMGLAAKHVPQDAQRLTLEEAREFGRMSGSCCVCGRRLDVPESVEAGIGPVCGSRMEADRW